MAYRYRLLCIHYQNPGEDIQTMIQFAQEYLNHSWEDIEPLTHLNHDETPVFGERLEIDLESYLQLEENGVLRIFTMREHSELLGYCIFVIYSHTHHARLIIADQDVIYINKRKRGHASRFVQYCDNELKKIGVHVVLQHSPVTKPWGKVLERIGYKELETTYSRRL